MQKAINNVGRATPRVASVREMARRPGGSVTAIARSRGRAFQQHTACGFKSFFS